MSRPTPAWPYFNVPSCILDFRDFSRPSFSLLLSSSYQAMKIALDTILSHFTLPTLSIYLGNRAILIAHCSSVRLVMFSSTPVRAHMYHHSRLKAAQCFVSFDLHMQHISNGLTNNTRRVVLSNTPVSSDSHTTKYGSYQHTHTYNLLYLDFYLTLDSRYQKLL